MKIVKFLSLLVIVQFASCSTEENESEQDIKSYYAGHISYLRGEFNIPLNATGKVRLEYDSRNRITKRIGGFDSYLTNSGYYYYYTFRDTNTDDIVYQNNEIKITQTTLGCVLCVFESKIMLDEKNRMIKKIKYHNNSARLNDTISYTYNNLNQIDETLTLYGNISKSKPRTYDKSKYYYNQKRNLDSIVTFRFDPYLPNLEDEIKIVEVFSNYDNAHNPIKKLIIFDENFHKSISANNFTKYEYRYYLNNQLTERIMRSTSFQYDSAGNVNFDFVPDRLFIPVNSN